MWCCFKRTDKRLERVDVCARAKRDAQRQMASMRHPDGVRIHLEWRASTNAHRPRQHSSMSSRNRNSSTLSAKELLVQALQSTSSSSSSSSSSTTSSLKQVARVHALLPSDLFGPASSERAAAAALLVPRHQATVLMCAELALSSLRHAKKLLPALLRVLALLPLCDTRNVYSTQVTQERFVESLIRSLLLLASRHEYTTESICESITRLVDALVTNVEQQISACFGALRGLESNNVAFSSPQCVALLAATARFAGMPDRAALAFQAEAAVLRSSGAGSVPPAVVAATWTRVFAHCGSTSQLRSSPVYASALRVAVACVVVDPSVGGDVYELISRHVGALHNQSASKTATLSPSSSNAASPAAAAAVTAASPQSGAAVPYADVFERNAVALVQAAAALAPLIQSAKAARKLTALIHALVDDLLAPSLSSRVRTECGAALTELLASCPSHAEKSVRHMVDEFFVQHDRYRDALSRDEQQRVLCEDLISPLVATLSRIAARLDDAAITRTMVQPLISRVELSFLPVDVLLLDHLMQLATLGHDDSHDEIVDLLIDVFVKIVDSKPPKKMPNTIANAFMTLAKKLNGAARRDRLLRRLLRLHQLLMQRVPRVSTDASAVTSVHLAASGRLLAPIAELMPDMRGVGALREYTVRVVRAATPNAVAGSDVDDAVHRSADELAHLLRSMWFSLVLWSQVRDTSAGTVASPAPAATASAQSQQQQQQANSRFSDSWLPTMASIACRMPSLAPGSQRVWLGMQAEVSTCLKHGFQKREPVVRIALQTLLPSQASALRTMTPELCAYVLAVHTLEVRRIGRSLTASAALQYIADDALEAAALVAPLRTVADELANTFRNFMKQLGARPARDKALAEATQALLIGLCHSSAAVRAAAAQHVDDLTRLYPHVLWNTSCLTTLLDLLDIVGKSVTTTNYVSFSVLPNSAVGVDLPEDSAGKRQLLTSMVVLATSWLKDALHRAPGETQALLHQYMHHFRRHSAAFLHHVGYSLAVDIATRAQIGKAKVVDDRPLCTVDNGSTFVNALELKALYTGEIDGMMKLLQQFGDDAGADVADALEGEPELNAVVAAGEDGELVVGAAGGGAVTAPESGGATTTATVVATLDDGDERPAAVVSSASAASFDSVDADALATLLPVNEERDVVMRRMAMVLLAKYRTFAAKFADGGLASPSDVEAFSATLYRTAAFLIARRSWSDMTQELIHLLAWAPVLPFTRASMRAGVFAWGWLMAARPDCSLALLSEMHDAWCWVIEQRRGLFAVDDLSGAVNILGEPQRGDIGDSVPVGKRHSDDDDDDDDAIARARREAAASAVQPGAATATASFFDVEPHRIWLAFLDERHTVWFQSSASHVATLRRMADRAVADPALLTASPSSLPARCLLLRWCVRFVDDGAFTVTLISLLRRERIYRASLGWFAGRPAWRAVESRADAERDIDAMVQFADTLERDHLFDTTGQAARRSHMLAGDVSQETVEQLSDMRNLIVLLLGHEMERAVAWNNPLSRPDKAFTKDVERFAVRHRRATARDWRVHVRAAWRASVHVAVRLGDRFRHSAAVREALAARIVQSGAARLAGDGDAVTVALLAVLEHGSSRKEDVVEQTLTALSRWAPTSPTAALRLLRTDFRSDSRVIDYALRSLRRCSVRAVIFLIPQLVQALRYDRTGLVEQFLRAAGRASELVAHQIIWNARIYTIKDDAGNTDGDLAPVAQRLSDAVVAQFDEQRATTYRLVFDFFENFTNASALLIKLKHTIEADEPGLAKDEIRARLTKRLFVELQKTPVEQVIGVAYLPTNPHWMVHDIVASKSFALQSAAKVPLFVSFTVSDRQHLPHTIAAVPDDVGAEQQRNDSDGYESDSEGDDDPDSVVATRHGVVAVNDALLDSMFDAASGDEDEYDDDEDDDDPDAVPSSALPSEKSEREAINKILGQTVSRRIREVAGDDEGDDDDDDDEDAGDVKLKPLSARGTANGTSGKRRAKKRASKASTALVAAAASKLTSSNAVALSTTSSAAAAVVAPHAAVVDAIVSDASLSRHERMKRLLETQPRNKRMQACIFKAGDDIRQDMLAIQIIELFKTILDDVGLDVYLYPYKVIATRPGCGIIEVVPNAKSRDAIGKYLDGNLMDYFISKYGPVNSEPFQRARTNFIQSMAAYAVVSYILQVKDRHNGNILIDDEGHLVHIDFGFIFDISPGGDFGFEVSPFKLSQEMIDVMGGEPGAEQFTYFMEQCVRAFLACRTHMESIITLVELMLETKLPCFKPGCIQRLRERFFPDKSEADAAVAMSAVALKAFSLIPFYTGYYYDVFQKMSQGISF